MTRWYQCYIVLINSSTLFTLPLIDILEIAEMAGKLYTPEYFIDLYMVVSSQPVFQSDLQQRIRLLLANQTWPNFITFFHKAHRELRKTETPIDELGYQSANAIVFQVVDQLRAAEYNNPPEPLVETLTIAPTKQLVLAQSNSTQDMVTLMSTIMQTIGQMIAQLVN